MGSFTIVRKASGALKDSTKVGLAKVNSDYKDLDIAIVKATNHVDLPPKERHVIRVRRLIVVEAGSKRIEGIITLSDIFRFLLS